MVWQFLVAVAVSLALFTAVGVFYPLTEGRRGRAEPHDQGVALLREEPPLHIKEPGPDGGLRNVLRENYLDLRSKIAERQDISIQSADTEMEILDRIVKGFRVPDADALLKVYRVYERSRFSNAVINEEELQGAISSAMELRRKVSW